MPSPSMVRRLIQQEIAAAAAAGGSVVGLYKDAKAMEQAAIQRQRDIMWEAKRNLAAKPQPPTLGTFAPPQIPAQDPPSPLENLDG